MRGRFVPCYLLHILEQPDEDPYDDENVKDVVGRLPQFYCAYCDPLIRLKPSAGFKCMQREAPCWKPVDRICETE
jgi:hypothetical protein